MENKKEVMVKMSKRGVSFADIGKTFGLSRQRAHQIVTGYHSPSYPSSLDPKDHKIWTPEKRKLLGLSSDPVRMSGGRDLIRELVRIRDNHTCQMCGFVWKQGNRRLDVHHADEKMEGRSAEKGAIARDKESIDKMVTLCHSCHMNLDVVKNKTGRPKGSKNKIVRNVKKSIPKWLDNTQLLSHTNTQGRVLTNVKHREYTKKVGKVAKEKFVAMGLDFQAPDTAKN